MDLIALNCYCAWQIVLGLMHILPLCKLVSVQTWAQPFQHHAYHEQLFYVYCQIWNCYLLHHFCNIHILIALYGFYRSMQYLVFFWVYTITYTSLRDSSWKQLLNNYYLHFLKALHEFWRSMQYLLSLLHDEYLSKRLLIKTSSQLLPTGFASTPFTLSLVKKWWCPYPLVQPYISVNGNTSGCQVGRIDLWHNSNSPCQGRTSWITERLLSTKVWNLAVVLCMYQ